MDRGMKPKHGRKQEPIANCREKTAKTKQNKKLVQRGRKNF